MLLSITDNFIDDNTIAFIKEVGIDGYDFPSYIAIMAIVASIVLFKLTKKLNKKLDAYDKRNKYITLSVASAIMFILSYLVYSKVLFPMKAQVSKEYIAIIDAKLNSLKESNLHSENILYLAMKSSLNDIQENENNRAQNLLYHLYTKNNPNIYSSTSDATYLKEQYEKTGNLEYFRYILENKIQVMDSDFEHFMHAEIAKKICDKKIRSSFYFNLRSCDMGKIKKNIWILDIDNKDKRGSFYLVKFQSEMKFKIANQLEKCSGYTYLKNEMVNVPKEDRKKAKKVLHNLKIKNSCK